MKVNQVFHYHPEKTQGVRTTLLFELYQTLSQLGAYNYQSISAARRVGLAARDYSKVPPTRPLVIRCGARIFSKGISLDTLKPPKSATASVGNFLRVVFTHRR